MLSPRSIVILLLLYQQTYTVRIQAKRSIAADKRVTTHKSEPDINADQLYIHTALVKSSARSWADFAN